MKKYVIIGLILAVIGAMVIVPMVKNNGNDPGVEDQLPATFSFDENLAARWDEAVDLEILFNSKDIIKLELIYNDSVFMKWNNPSGTLNYQFKAGFYGLGTRNLKLVSTMTDGETFTDDRMVRVLSDVVPEIWIAEVRNSFPHKSTSFTQGLEFDQGMLYEGTGQKGASLVAQVELKPTLNADGTYELIVKNRDRSDNNSSTTALRFENNIFYANNQDQLIFAESEQLNLKFNYNIFYSNNGEPNLKIDWNGSTYTNFSDFKILLILLALLGKYKLVS